MAYTLTPSTAAIFPSSSVTLPSQPFTSWSVNLLGAGDAGRYFSLFRAFNSSLNSDSSALISDFKVEDIAAYFRAVSSNLCSLSRMLRICSFKFIVFIVSISFLRQIQHNKKINPTAKGGGLFKGLCFLQVF